MTDLTADPLRRFYLPSDRRAPSPGRPAGIAVAVLVHIAVLYFVLTAHNPVTIFVPQTLQVTILDEAKPKPEELPPPPPVKLVDLPPPFIPAPEIIIQTPPPAAVVQTATTVKPAAPVPVGPTLPAPPVAAVKIPPDLDSAHSSDPEYPSMSRRMEEEGNVGLLVLVEPDGNVSDVRLELSSGHNLLDESAIQAAKTRSRFKPGTIDGKPARMWYRYRYTFRLH